MTPGISHSSASNSAIDRTSVRHLTVTIGSGHLLSAVIVIDVVQGQREARKRRRTPGLAQPRGSAATYDYTRSNVRCRAHTCLVCLNNNYVHL